MAQERRNERSSSARLSHYREQYEQMYIRALAAEMKAATAKMKLQDALKQSKSHRHTIADLQNELTTEKTRNSENELSLAVAKDKLNKLKPKLKIEFDKILHNQKDIRVGVNSFLRCVYEYRQEVISREDFFCAVDLIFSSLLMNDSMVTSPSHNSNDPSSTVEVLFNSTRIQELASLPPEQRRKKLEVFIDRLSPEKLFSQTSDKLLSYVFEEPSSVPPPLPMKPSRFQKRIPDDFSRSTGSLVAAGRDSPPPLPQKLSRKPPTRVMSSDSDSDFEGNDEIQKIRSEPSLNRIIPKGDGSNKSSNLLRQTRKQMDRRKQLYRSKSTNQFNSNANEFSFVGQSDETTTELPQQQLKVWQKMISIRDSSVLTGSLPRLNLLNNQTDKETVTEYVTPNDFKAFVSRAKDDGGKISDRASKRVMQRFDTLLQSYCVTDQSDYLKLIGNRKSKRLNWPEPADRPIPQRKLANYENHFVHNQTSAKSVPTHVSSTAHAPSSPIPSLPAKESPIDGSNPQNTSQDSHVGDPVFDVHNRDRSDAVIDIIAAAGKPSHMVDIEIRRKSEDNHKTPPPVNEVPIESRPPASLPKPKPKPLPKRRKPDATNTTKSAGTPTSTTKFPDQIPTYCTLKRNATLRLVPMLHSGTNQDPEEDPGDYSLGTFQYIGMKKSALPLRKDSFQNDQCKLPSKTSSSDTDDGDSSDGYETPPDATEGYIEPRSTREGISGRDRSYTTNLVTRNRVVEKQGYMEKLDPRLKHLTKRWFVLKGKELKYYSKMKSRKPKGVINLETWCKISRHEMTNSFQLATPSRTYHFLADNNVECEEWIKALQTVMRLCQSGGTSGQPEDTISSYLKLVVNNTQILKCWVSIVNQLLQVYQLSSDTKPLYVFSLANAHIRYGTDVPLASISKCSSLPFCTKEDFSIVIEMGGAEVQSSNSNTEEERVTLLLSNKEEREVWFYHLISASSYDTGPELTLTEKLVTRLWRSAQGCHGNGCHDDDESLWNNPILNYSSKPISESLLSHPSTAQINEAVEIFKIVNLFIETPFDSLGLDYHIMTFQQLVSKCLSSPGLRDEMYCQILRQISCSKTSSSSKNSLGKSNILQGWLMLSLLIPLFIPTRKIFQWYLEAVLLRAKKGKDSTAAEMAEAAQVCHQRFLRAEKKGSREKTPSWFELHSLMSGPVHISRFMLSLKLKLPVNLMNDTTLLMEFDSSSEVQEFISHLNQEIGMPDSETTGFALMSDWPGEDDEAGFYLFPSNKLCDVISTWYECLSDLSSTTVHTRNIQLTYRKRLHFKERRGMESDKEALLLTYQISKDVLNEYYYVGKVELALDITARMAQIDYGDCDSIKTDQQQLARDAIRRFCPIKFTKMILPHDMDDMVSRLLMLWKGYQGMNRHACARILLSLFADNWGLFGSTVFFCIDKYSVLTHVKNGPVWLAIHQQGVTLLNANYLVKPIVSYTYKEVATFGGHSDDFMLVVNSRHRISNSRSVSTPALFNSQTTDNENPVQNTEKIILSMSKLKIREATYLMASYLDALSEQ